MKISTKGRYGLRAMVDLAMNSNDDFISLGQVAERQGISMNYLEHAFSSLKKSGLVRSVAGANGGYKLGRHPKDITVYDILYILEGDLTITEPIIPEEETLLQSVLRDKVWDPINEKIKTIIKNTTIQDLIDKQTKRLG